MDITFTDLTKDDHGLLSELGERLGLTQKVKKKKTSKKKLKELRMTLQAAQQDAVQRAHDDDPDQSNGASLIGQVDYPKPSPAAEEPKQEKAPDIVGTITVSIPIVRKTTAGTMENPPEDYLTAEGVTLRGSTIKPNMAGWILQQIADVDLTEDIGHAVAEELKPSLELVVATEEAEQTGGGFTLPAWEMNITPVEQVAQQIHQQLHRPFLRMPR